MDREPIRSGTAPRIRRQNSSLLNRPSKKPLFSVIFSIKNLNSPNPTIDVAHLSDPKCEFVINI